MARINKKVEPIYTHEGAKAQHLNPELQLRRSVMSCMLWEKEFYEDGQTIADRIKELVPKVDKDKVSAMAIEAREKMKLRHVPLLLCREMARNGMLDGNVLARVIQRADELSEFLSMYWLEGKQPLAAQVKKGLALAFQKFDEYAISKYNRDNAVKLRDVLFLCHAKPINNVQEALWKKLIDGTLTPPDTWEVGLSSGADKKATWERLLSENKLGGMALLRNLRNFKDHGVDEDLVIQGLESMKVGRILPFRFLVAAKHVPRFEPYIEDAFFRCCSNQPKLPGKTILIVDVSGSMYGSPISKYSALDRANVACCLSTLIRELCEKPIIYATAGNDGRRIHATQEVPARRGFALCDTVYGLCNPLGGGGIFLKQVMAYVKNFEKSADRIIVITDEQDCDVDTSPLSADTFGTTNYLINVGSNKNGIGYGKWTHIDGWSEAVIDYIMEYERGLSDLQ